MTVGRRWRLRCHSVPPADRRCFPSSAVLPQPLLASLALGVSPWAHGRGMDWIIGSPDFDRLDRDRIRTPDWDCGLCVQSRSVAGLFFVIRKQRPTEFWLYEYFEAFAFSFGTAMALHFFIQAACAGCHRSASHGANGHRPLARRTPRCLFIGAHF